MIQGQVAIGASLGTEATCGIHTDRLETPKLLTTSGGTVVWKAVYEAFGKGHLDEDPDVNSSLVSLATRLPGQTLDPELATHYNLHRYFDPAAGRYISADRSGNSAT